LKAPLLKWVHCDQAGLTHSARPEVFARKITITGSAGRSAPALAEHALMFCLLLSSGYPGFYEAQRRQEWRRTPEMKGLRALYGQTIGILGVGHTGMAIAARAKAFEMRILGYRRRDEPAPPGFDEVFSADKGQTIFPILEEADFVVLALNLSDATRHLINDEALRRMKRDAFLINLARGSVVDQDALILALKEGRIAGAGLDVTDPEPLPSGHPLWTAPNVLITPHFSAASADKSERSLSIIIENLQRYRQGAPLLNRLLEEDVWTG
jgi:phosphoglycerate dehydrogenase-like enzyme